MFYVVEFESCSGHRYSAEKAGHALGGRLVLCQRSVNVTQAALFIEASVLMSISCTRKESK